MMWLTFNMVKIEGPKNKQTSRIIVSRVNMDMVISYFEAPEDVRNNKNENLRANTFMMLDLEGNRVFSVLETVDEIDDMVAAYAIDTEVVIKNSEIKVAPKPKDTNDQQNGWGANTSGGW